MKKILILIILLIPLFTQALVENVHIDYWNNFVEEQIYSGMEKTINGEEGTFYYDGDHTIIFDNYKGPGILLTTYVDFNIILKGTNIFSGDTNYMLCADVSSGKITIEGQDNAKVIIEQFHSFIVYDRKPMSNDLTIKNITFEIGEVSDVIMYYGIDEGNYKTLTIDNCHFNTKNTEKLLNVEGVLVIKNSTFDAFEDIDEDYGYNYISNIINTNPNTYTSIIENSTFNYESKYVDIAGGLIDTNIDNFEITNSNFNIKNMGFLIYEESNLFTNQENSITDVTINDSKINMKNNSYASFAFVNNLEVNNSKIDVEAGNIQCIALFYIDYNLIFNNSEIKLNVLSAPEWCSVIDSGKVIVKDSDLLISYTNNSNNIIGIRTWEGMTFDNSIIYINIKDGIALLQITDGDAISTITVTGKYQIQGNKTIKKVNDGFYLTTICLDRSDDEIIETLNDFNEELIIPPEDYSTLIIDSVYTYEIIEGDKQQVIKNENNEYSFKIDGNHLLLDKVIFNNVELIKDIDYTVTKGSTIITLTDTGLNKIKNINNGKHNIKVTYTNGEEVNVEYTLADIKNPKTGDNLIIYILLSIISFITLITLSKRTRKI